MAEGKRKLRSFYQRHRGKIWYGLLIFTMLFSFAVLGPLAQATLIDPQKPYILVDSDERINILNAQVSGLKSCQIPPYTPVEMTGNPSGKVEKIIMDVVPMEYLPYVHYPDNWDSGWNMFNPNTPLGPIVKDVLSWVAPGLAIILVVYGIVMWRKGRFKNWLRRLLPYEDD